MFLKFLFPLNLQEILLEKTENFDKNKKKIAHERKKIVEKHLTK